MEMKKNSQYIIRLDDITPTMDWERFNRIREVFQKYHICPLIGVVPDNRDENLNRQESRQDFWEIICSLQQQGWSIAQHGTYHCYETKDSGILGINPFSEFAGLPYEKQYQKLQTGKKILEGNHIKSDIFMAPGHTYDKNTLKALEECGFQTVTDGLYYRPYHEGDILFIPCRLQGYKKSSGIDTICLHTNSMSDADIQELEEFIKANHDVILPFIPEQIKKYAVKRNIFVAMYEKMTLCRRKIKNRIANSKRLAWYMEYTNHSSSLKKWASRIYSLPMLLFYRANKE